MRFVVAIAGILLSLPLGVFFWIGSRTFIRNGERAFARAVLVAAVGLFGLSLAALFVPSLARANAIGVVAALLAYVGFWLYAKRRRRLPPSP